ncbi:MAG: YicC/YloC family endoribonuclease [Tuberibacillus sp.]
MIASMTGYGRSAMEAHGRTIIVELKSVNNRFLDIDFSMPKAFAYLEEQLKSTIRRYIKRGKVTVHVTAAGEPLPNTKLDINWPLLEQYHLHIKDIADQFRMPLEWNIHEVLQLPGVLTQVESDPDLSDMEPLIYRALEDALEKLVDMRITEGKKIDRDFRERIIDIKKYIEDVQAKAPQVVAQYRERLANRIHEFLNGRYEADEERIMNEVAVFADKADISEELLRFNSHIDQFLDIIEKKEPKGRKLDFLIQEMNREINTIGSKANSADISHLVVAVKSECEKLREQIQNVE